MSDTQQLTSKQEEVLVIAMLRAGVDRGTAESAVRMAQILLDSPAPPRSVSVHQQATVVEAGATMIGYKADRIG